MKKRLALILALILVAVTLTGCKSGDYNKAVKFQEAGDYASALELYKGIEDYENYKDTASRVSDCEAMIKAIEDFKAATSAVEEMNAQLDAAIAEAEALVAEKAPALDTTLSPALETAISEAKAARVFSSEMPATKDEIVYITEQLNEVDYTSTLSNLSDRKAALETSIKQYALVDAPTEAYIIKCLQRVDNVVDISAVTEENDPNGQMNKAGGYTADVFFTSDLVDQSQTFGTTVIEKGTDAGGSIEVYTTAEDAIARNEYLGAFDGSILSSGSHCVIGTVVVRTSDLLTASQQKAMEANIIDSLTKID